jgi:hypothetical protein
VGAVHKTVLYLAIQALVKVELDNLLLFVILDLSLFILGLEENA